MPLNTLMVNKTSFTRGYHTIGTICNVIDMHFMPHATFDTRRIAYYAAKYGYAKRSPANGLFLISGSFVLAMLGLMVRERRCRIPMDKWDAIVDLDVSYHNA